MILEHNKYLLEPNKYGRTCTPTNSYQLIFMLYKKYPRDSKDEAAKRFAKEINKYPKFITEFAIRYHSLHYTRITQPTTTSKQANKRETVERIKKIIQTNFLSSIMPNGKKLADCNGTECVKMGGWLTTIGKQVGPKNLVGDVLSEKSIHSVWQQHYK